MNNLPIPPHALLAVLAKLDGLIESLTPAHPWETMRAASEETIEFTVKGTQFTLYSHYGLEATKTVSTRTPGVTVEIEHIVRDFSGEAVLNELLNIETAARAVVTSTKTMTHDHVANRRTTVIENSVEVKFDDPDGDEHLLIVETRWEKITCACPACENNVRRGVRPATNLGTYTTSTIKFDGDLVDVSIDPNFFGDAPDPVEMGIVLGTKFPGFGIQGFNPLR